jgi:hypothetical protein
MEMFSAAREGLEELFDHDGEPHFAPLRETILPPQLTVARFRLLGRLADLGRRVTDAVNFPECASGNAESTPKTRRLSSISRVSF